MQIVNRVSLSSVNNISSTDIVLFQCPVQQEAIDQLIRRAVRRVLRTLSVSGRVPVLVHRVVLDIKQIL